MTTELQNKVWSILPKEFKEEVKRLWQSADKEQQLPHDAFLRGEYSMLVSLFGHHNLTSDAKWKEILIYEKSKAMQLYSHLLDLVENERMGEHYSEWCDFEREYTALFGENVFANYFGTKCLPDELNEDNFATKKPKPAEPKEDKHFDNILKDDFRDHNRLHIAAMAMQGILSNADRMNKYEYVATEPPCDELAVVVARKALRYADVLIAECEKGNNHD